MTYNELKKALRTVRKARRHHKKIGFILLNGERIEWSKKVKKEYSIKIKEIKNEMKNHFRYYVPLFYLIGILTLGCFLILTGVL